MVFPVVDFLKRVEKTRRNTALILTRMHTKNKRH